LLDTESLIGGVGQARAAVIKTQNAKPSQLGQQVASGNPSPARAVQPSPVHTTNDVQGFHGFSPSTA